LYKEEYDVYIGRGSIFGNDFTHLDKEKTKAKMQVPTREEAINCYKEVFYWKINYDPYFKEQVLKLKGKILGCYCKPKKCHGDIIVEFLENYNGD
jgi:hypothetical protein